MVKKFHSLKVSQKLMLVSVFFMLPDSIMLYLFITGINENIHFGQLEQTVERWLPPHIEAAADERNLRPRAGRLPRQMRRPAWCSGDARGIGRTGTEHLGVNVIRRDAQGSETGGQIIHEGRRSANIEIGVARQVQFLEHPRIQMSGRVEIHIRPVLRIGCAVANVTVMAGQPF